MPPKVERERAEWDDIKDKYLLKGLLKQIKLGKRSDSGFKKEAWTAVTEGFNSKFSPPYEREQVKARINSLKRRYDIFQRVCDNSGFGWDNEREIPTASDEVWTEYLKKHKDAKQFRYKTLANYNLLHEIFARSIATGAAASGTTDQLLTDTSLVISDKSQSLLIDIGSPQSTQTKTTTTKPSLITELSDIEIELQNKTQPESNKANCSDSEEWEDYQYKITRSTGNKRRIRATSETLANDLPAIKKPKNATYAAAESLQNLAKAFTQSKQMRAPPIMTKLEEALNIMSTLVTAGKWKDEDYVEAYKIMLKDERHAIFFCSAPEHIQEKWINTMRANGYEGSF